MTVDSGLPGDHHFYITFRTTHSGVEMAPHLRALHPEDMTIVLQHQFWDLEVTEDWFAVSLSFSGKREHLHIPFEAVTAFADPFAKFGLQFQIDMEDDELLDDDFEDDLDEPLELRPDASDEAAARGESESGDNVVTLDAFRKK